MIKVKEERKTKPLRVSSPDEATDLKKSVKYSFAKEEASSKIHEDHPLPSTGSKELKKKGLKREELKREELKKEELKGSKDSETSGDISDPLMVKDSQVKKI
jgi:5-formaminoimidazole-4-carboxamide-1-beta-D-ribofuranosyl 5'-monophosphate synthetase